MKAKTAAQARLLQDIPNIGPSIAGDLRAIGIREPRQLIGRDPYELYALSNEKAGVRQDPCLIDCFISAVRFMEGASPRPWWKYTPERKRHLGTANRAHSTRANPARAAATSGANSASAARHTPSARR